MPALRDRLAFEITALQSLVAYLESLLGPPATIDPHMPIYELHLSNRLYNCLKNLGFETLIQVAEGATYKEMMCTENLGHKTMGELQIALNAAGLILAGAPRSTLQKLSDIYLLRDRQRTALQLRSEGKTIREIAVSMGISHSAASNAIHRAADFLSRKSFSGDPLHEFARKMRAKL
jgi:DNA-binding CsgD family transcriptional regulator